MIEIDMATWREIRPTLKEMNGGLYGVKPGTKKHELPGPNHEGHFVEYARRGGKGAAQKAIVARLESRGGVVSFFIEE